ncbi:MAG: hypothetical protein IPI44_15065 [Sulfuritalea sp.]|nr:hypothetical protein [Sulfuritalea sp.]
MRKLKNGDLRVEVHGFDYFDTVKAELVSGGKGRIAMWSLDTDYDERLLFPHQVFFPMAGKGRGLGQAEEGHSRRTRRRPAAAISRHGVAALRGRGQPARLR